jgi:hypothetical protein
MGTTFVNLCIQGYSPLLSCSLLFPQWLDIDFCSYILSFYLVMRLRFLFMLFKIIDLFSLGFLVIYFTL